MSEKPYTRIPNCVLDALCSLRLAGEPRQILDVVIRQTFGYSKDWDAISYSQFEQKTGQKRRSVDRGIRRLESWQILQVDRKGYTNRYRVNECPDAWKHPGLHLPADLPKIEEESEGGRNSAHENVRNSATYKRKKKVPTLSSQDRDTFKMESPHGQIVRYWHEAYERRFGRKYLFNNGRDGAHIKRLLETYDPETFRELIDAFLETDDGWINEKGLFTIGGLMSQANRLALQVKGGGSQKLTKEDVY